MSIVLTEAEVNRRFIFRRNVLVANLFICGCAFFISLLIGAFYVATDCAVDADCSAITRPCTNNKCQRFNTAWLFALWTFIVWIFLHIFFELALEPAPSLTELEKKVNALQRKIFRLNTKIAIHGD